MAKLITIQNTDISIKTSKEGNDYISLTDMAKWKNPEDPRFVVQKIAFNQIHHSIFGYLGRVAQ